MSQENDHLSNELHKTLEEGSGPKIARFALACLGGGIPFVGGAFGAGAGAWSEANQSKVNTLFEQWLKMQKDELEEIGRTLFEVFIRLDQTDEKVQERIQSPECLSLIKKCFRDWSAAESEDKRKLIRNLLANAASCDLVTNDVVRLFIEWIDRYSETHFKVISCIYRNVGFTRRDIWSDLHQTAVRDDSPEADLFRVIIYDLSVGHIIRQHREVDYHGRYIKQTARKPKGSSPPFMTSAFDDEKQYDLTKLGRQFVHYTMNEIVPKLQDASASP